MIVASALALALRLYQLARPGFLHGITEYDDGVYFGSAIRVVHGVLPYRDFVLVHPPGITLLMTPFAWLARAIGTGDGFAVARLLSAGAGAAAVPLAGLLVYRTGVLPTVLACGILAAYPAGINAAHTVLLEPWLVLFCLLGTLAVFDGDDLAARRGRLVWGGVAFGFAAAIKLWALAPVLVLLLLCWRRLPLRASAAYLGGLLAGFGLPVVPFFALAPRAFMRDVITAQLSRVDLSRVPTSARLTSLTGLSVFSPVNYAIVVLLAIGLGTLALVCSILASRRSRRLPPPRELFALGTAGVVLAAFLWPADYYPHYGWFFAPFLALSLALPVARLSARAPTPLTLALGGLAAAILLALAGVEVAQLRKLHTGAPARAAARQITPGACVLSDLPALTIVSNRFTSRVAGCASLVDPIGTDYALSHGRNGVTGAGRTPAVAAIWLSAFAHADYVWLQCPPTTRRGCLTDRRIPWTRSIRLYFHHNFEPVRGPGALVNLYVRRAGGRRA